MFLLIILDLLGSTCASRLDTVSIPAYRKTLQQNAPAAIQHMLQYNDTWLYGGWFTEIGVGEPPQYLQLLIDTGSSDLWIPAAQADTCHAGHCMGGSFESQKSTTFKDAQIPWNFTIGYLDGSFVIGNYSNDTIKYGTAILPNFTFGLADHIDVTPGDLNGPQYGILGLGHKSHQTGACPFLSQNCSGGFELPTLHDALYAAGYIGSRSYSLYLQHNGIDAGNILFGGIDKARFTGPLVTFGTTQQGSGPQKGKFLRQSIQLTGFSTQINGSTKSQPSELVAGEALFDTGNTGISLPSGAKSIVESF